MTNPVNYPGITVNITNPSNNNPQNPFQIPQYPQQHYHHHCCSQPCGMTYPNTFYANNNNYYPNNYYQPPQYVQQQGMYFQPQLAYTQYQNPPLEQYSQGYVTNPQYIQQNAPYQVYSQQPASPSQHENVSQQVSNQYQPAINQYYSQTPNSQPTGEQNTVPNNTTSGYPVQYYLNNYNYATPNQEVSTISPQVQDGTIPQQVPVNDATQPQLKPEVQPEVTSKQPQQTSIQPHYIEDNTVSEEEDMSISEQIIENLDKEIKEEKQTQKKQKKVKIVALTNEYIMSLENYLNNPNKEVRILAAKEVLKRLNEDRDRYNDLALNALINKMIQDPEKLVRIAALSALSSELASGNDYTIKLIKDIQANPKSSPEDVLEASNILLKMSASKELKYRTVEENNNQNQEI